MKKIAPLWISAFLGLTGILVCSILFFSSKRQPVEKTVAVPALRKERSVTTKEISFEYTVTNISRHPINYTEIYIYGPNKKAGGQFNIRMTSANSYTLETDNLNNQILCFPIEDLPPYGTKIISIDSQVEVSSWQEKTLLDNPARFLAEEPNIELSSRELIELSEQLSSREPKETVRRIFDWITASIKSAPYSAKERGALYTFRKKKGDCTEHMHLFIALCRLNQIPARGVSGFIVTRNKRLKASDYHDWAEVYLDGAWQPVDPFNKVYQVNQQDYISMRVHNPVNDKFDFHRWKSGNENVQIAMSR
jgi:hypothetical protein